MEPHSYSHSIHLKIQYNIPNPIKIMIAIINPYRNLINLTTGNFPRKEVGMKMTIEGILSTLEELHSTCMIFISLVLRVTGEVFTVKGFNLCVLPAIGFDYQHCRVKLFYEKSGNLFNFNDSPIACDGDEITADKEVS